MICEIGEAAVLLRPGVTSVAMKILDHVKLRTPLPRGWRASIQTDRNERERLNAANQAEWGAFPTGDWSEPMQSALTDLASKSPFRLGEIAEVLPGCPVRAGLQCHPRLTVQRGIDDPAVREEEHLPRCSPREPRRGSRWR
jgi:hypothetical protein